MPLLSSHAFENWSETETSRLSPSIWPYLDDMVGLSFMALFHPDLSFYDIICLFYGKRNATK